MASQTGASMPAQPRKHPPGTLLSTEASTDADEPYSEDEKLLNEFTKLHPMCSMEAASSRTLQLLANMTEKAHIHVPELPVVGMSHDNMFLEPPNLSIGERECICGQRCLAKFMAMVRYGPDTDKGFVCKEFLLPEQHKAFLDGKGLPAQREKCLICSRYYLNYIYILARTDANFKIPEGVRAQRFTNPAGELPDHNDVVNCAASVPTHASLASCADGYKPQALLFVDEEFACSNVQRTTALSALSFRPVVRFCSSHYRYVGKGDSSRIVQVGIGMQRHVDDQDFWEPSPSEASTGTAMH